MTGKQPFRIPSGFTAIPHKVARALTDGSLDHTDVAVLIALFFRVRDETWTVRITLEEGGA
jgi:hypothetical protein